MSTLRLKTLIEINVILLFHKKPHKGSLKTCSDELTERIMTMLPSYSVNEM